MDNEQKIIEIITKLNQISQKNMVQFFAKVDIRTKLNIIQHQRSIFHKIKSAYTDVDNAVLTLASLILAINSVVKETDKVNLNAVKMRGKNQKTKVKRQKLLGYWAIVKTLKLEQNMSFRNIAGYFKKYHKLEVSYSTIHGLWIELEATTTNNEEN
ncbi:MAG: hypothetical protein ACMV1K_01215 [Sulfurospirillum sp.]